MRAAAGALGVTVFVLCHLAGAARAQVDLEALPDVTDTDYGLDVYLGPVLGSARIVGMGGAAVAMAEGSAGILANPAAPGVRPSTSKDRWDWDFHVDWLSPQIGTDFDNNGIVASEDDLAANPFFTAGLVGNYREWALGVSGSSFQPNTTGGTEAGITVVQLALARSFWRGQIVGGASFRSGTFAMQTPDQDLFSVSGTSLELGAVWKPAPIDIRVGGSVSFPVVGEETAEGNTCDPMDCDGYILPERIEVPWRIAGGVAWRRAPTRWNRTVAGDFRDEKSLTVAGDLVAVGGVDDGHGIEAFAQKKLQRSGRKVVLSFRGGVEYEWFPGRFRVRAGSYWEPGRFRDHENQTVPGRLHATLGLELRIYAFRLWGDPYRVRLTLTSDGADKYVNGGLSLGFWH